jgi:hypothetical protein
MQDKIKIKNSGYSADNSDRKVSFRINNAAAVIK